MGSRGEDPIGSLVDEPPKLILILEMDVKLELVLSKEGKEKERKWDLYSAYCQYLDH